jgi:hypothetical protein
MARNRDYAEHVLEVVERKRSRPPTEQQVERTLAAMCSPDENVRTDAVRHLCPCRVPWPVYQQNLGAVQALRKDPSPQVRRAALHLEEDANHLERMEERLRASERRHDEAAAEQRKRSSRGGRGPRGTESR